MVVVKRAISPPQDNGNIATPTQSSLNVPQFSDLERKVIDFSSESGDKTDLLAQADYGERFHSSVSLFVGNYTLGESSNFAYALEHNEPVWPWMVEKLLSFASAIRNNGESNSDYTIRRCEAAEGLYEILKKAEKEGHIDEAGKVVGYLDRASSMKQSVFSGFGFFYQHDSNHQDGPRTILSWYRQDVFKVQEMTERAKTAFGSLSGEVRNELTAWVGKYGHDALEGMSSQTIWFKDNKPDRITHVKMLPDIPPAPLFGKDIFYQRFGEDLMCGYGLISCV